MDNPETEATFATRHRTKTKQKQKHRTNNKMNNTHTSKKHWGLPRENYPCFL